MPFWEEQLRKTIKFSGDYEINTPEGIFTVEIKQDDEPGNPRDWDNAGHFLFHHKRYNLGDTNLWKELGINHNEFNSWDEVSNWLTANLDIAVIYQVRMYDHSGITISISKSYPFNDQWDSGCIGLAYMTKDDLRENFVCKNVTKSIIEKGRALLQAEIETYDDYLTGNVYGYNVNHDISSGDSCWGYYGDISKSGIVDEVVSIIKCCISEIQEKRRLLIKKHCNKRKAQIKYKVPLKYRKSLII